MALLIFAALLFAPIAAQADIYVSTDADGVITFTDVKTKNAKVIKTSIRFKKSDMSRSKDYQEFIQRAAYKYDVDPELIEAVITAESNFNPVAVSKKGAQGLMQLMPKTANDMGVRNAFNPEQNIEGGVKYLKHLLNRFNGNLSMALAAYNAGPGRVERHGDVPPIPETKNYVKKILASYEEGSYSPQYSDHGVSFKSADAPEPQASQSSTPSKLYMVYQPDGTVLLTDVGSDTSKKRK